MSHYQIVPLSGLQRLNAQNLQQAQREAAYATLHARAEVDALEEMRAQAAHDPACPVCPYVMRAAALALGEFPRLNAQFSSEGLCAYEEVSLGVMVARDDGVLVPAVRGAGQKSPRALAAAGAEAARQVYEGQMHRHRTRRPTFTLIDLSRYAVDTFTPILPARSAGILGVSRAEGCYRPDADGQPRLAAVQGISLTFDHRAADGPYAARFLSAVVRRLEQPDVLRQREEETFAD